MKLTIVGCTGSFPGPGSPASCYLLTANDGERNWKIVLDLGSGALGAIQRYTDLEDIDAIFLTHLHPDHCMDLCGLHVAVRWKPGGWGRGGFRCGGPPPPRTGWPPPTAWTLDPGMHEEFDFSNWSERKPVTMGPFTVTPYAVNHPVEEAYALRVEVTEPDKDGNPRHPRAQLFGGHRLLRRPGGRGPRRRPLPLRSGLRGRPRRRDQGRPPDREAGRGGRRRRRRAAAAADAHSRSGHPRPPSWPRPRRSSARTWPSPSRACTTPSSRGPASGKVRRGRDRVSR